MEEKSPSKNWQWSNAKKISTRANHWLGEKCFSWSRWKSKTTKRKIKSCSRAEWSKKSTDYRIAKESGKSDQRKWTFETENQRWKYWYGNTGFPTRWITSRLSAWLKPNNLPMIILELALNTKRSKRESSIPDNILDENWSLNFVLITQ